MKQFLKTISWLIVSGLLIAGSVYAETHSLKAATIAAFWACLVKTPVYWLHEIIWDRAGIKAPCVDSDVVIEAIEEAVQSQ